MGVWGAKLPFILLAIHGLVQGGCRCEELEVPEEGIDHYSENKDNFPLGMCHINNL